LRVPAIVETHSTFRVIAARVIGTRAPSLEEPRIGGSSEHIGHFRSMKSMKEQIKNIFAGRVYWFTPGSGKGWDNCALNRNEFARMRL
jgi:hypothetical protein